MFCDRRDDRKSLVFSGFFLKISHGPVAQR
jgi:hypothetical protein